ncbi:Swt1 family HEPN domain-containing protein [Microbispora sp. NPDC046973]|uniref:Swt1 family HEPN domain-containing protein n=1 Tax=Microbispora sp. NPDC046973 TaxID=3155022 RepID=UPI0033E5B9ED
MALSHAQRVGKGFELLAEGLEPVVDRLMQAAAPAGKDWLDLIAAKEAAKHGGGMKLSKHDPQLQLKVITDHKNVFHELIGHNGYRYASELREVRNAWAHNDKFTFYDADRALDTMERLLRVAGAVDAAEQVLAQREEHRSQTDDKRARDKIRKSSPVALSVDGHGLKSWREVVIPHPDVRTGQYASAEFAADLHQVATGKSTSEEYSDPIQFFNRTYLTEGIKELLTNAARRIAGDGNAEPVFNLQTNFGGGKTHSMLSLWHLYAPGLTIHDFPQPVQDMLGNIPLRSGVRRVALVGNRIEAAKPSSKDGRPGINTLWGELAWQLGGQDAYDIIAAADHARTPPGDSLQDLLEKYAPCVILIDEWVAYARLLHGRSDLPGGTFEGQFTFAQTLTEVAKAVPGVMLVVSVPASHDPKDKHARADEAEVGGVRGQEALERLQNVVGRVAKHWRPASSDESFEIVRRRLFEDLTPQGQRDRDVIAKAMISFYREHTGEFPHAVTDRNYEDEIKRAYPIHPELFHRLYEDWSALERFQRTRGVLRLMSAVIFRLWQEQDPAPLIMPGSVPVNDEWVLGEVTHYLSDSWKAVIEADVDAPHSTPEQIDKSRPAFSQRHLTRRLARAAFLASAARSGAQQKGVERKRIWLGTALPGDVVGNFASAIHLLSEQALYFYVDGSSYWYDTQQSVNRLARDRAEEYRSHPEDIYVEIVDRLRKRDADKKHKDVFGRVFAGMESGDITETTEVSLALVHPRYHYSAATSVNPARDWAMKTLESRGETPRVNQNMLVFVAADRELLGYLMDAVRDYLAWDSIVEDRDLPLVPDQMAMARKRRKTADDTVWLRLTQAYNTVIYPIWDDRTGRVGLRAATLDDEGDVIPARVGVKLRNLDQLRVVMGSRLIRHDLEKKLSKVWANGHVSLGDLWQYYCRFPYLSRLRNRRVLEEGIYNVLEETTGEFEGFAIAAGYDEQDGRYIELVIPGRGEYVSQLTDHTLLVELNRAKAQRLLEEQQRQPDPTPGGGDADPADTTGNGSGPTEKPNADGSPSPGPTPPLPPAPRNTRFWGFHRVNPERFSRDLNNLAKDLLALLTAPDGVELEVEVQITARRAEGFSDDTIMKVMENLGHLKVEGKFEDN